MLVHKRLGAVKVTNSLQSALSSIQNGSQKNQHDPEGRLQYAEFATFDLLHTYVPNRGWTNQKIAVRAAWDQKIVAFLKKRAEATPQKPLLWCGDLNVAHTPADSTNEDFFRDEWDRDNKVYGGKKEKYLAAIPAEDRGIPGFADSERRSFDELLQAGDFIDAWRSLHPVGETPLAPEDASFTWRGTTAVQGNFRARYEGMAQRLDYFLLPKSFAEERMKSCEILGHGVDRQGFLGSDHSPVELHLASAPP